MWDKAASLCFITNTKAKQEKLKGSKVELSVIKVGAQSEKIKTIKYKVPLIDEQGHVIEFEAYSIERITPDIESVNTDNIVHLFECHKRKNRATIRTCGHFNRLGICSLSPGKRTKHQSSCAPKELFRAMHWRNAPVAQRITSVS